MMSQLRDRGFDLQSCCPIMIRDRSKNSFWHDIWKGDQPLAITFHKVFAIDSYRSALVRDRVLLKWDNGFLKRFPRGGIKQKQWDDFTLLMQGLQLDSRLDLLG